MANEIKVLGAQKNTVRLCFYVPIPLAQRKTDANATPIAPDATVGLDAATLAVLSVGEQIALDAGEALLVFTSYQPVNGETGPEALAKVREMYASASAGALADFAERYQYADRVGAQYDAV